MVSRPYLPRPAETAQGLKLCIFLLWLCLPAVFPAVAFAAPGAVEPFSGPGGVESIEAKGAVKTVQGDNTTPGDGPEREMLPIVVTAKTLVADNRKKTVTYRTDVVVKRGDVTLYADEVVIRFSGEDDKGGGPGAGELFSGTGGVETIEAKGGVKIVQKDKTATSDEAVYDASEEKITLTGSPRVWQGPNVLTGSSISFDVAEDTITVEDAKTLLYQGTETGGVRGGPVR